MRIIFIKNLDVICIRKGLLVFVVSNLVFWGFVVKKGKSIVLNSGIINLIFLFFLTLGYLFFLGYCRRKVFLILKFHFLEIVKKGDIWEGNRERR